ncbi:DUF3592 domain-containing protein [Neotabrizicola sp. sgz301269]|uniref:DUF3592 domain-containing protein n=1 Tax=Neotabrizicola sp. sgz301269 TaxID=3276282 RepID=UPI00377001D9
MRSFLTVILLAGLGVAIWALAGLWSEAQSYRWRAVPAVITQSDLTIAFTVSSVAAASAAPTSQRILHWDFAYAYRLDGMDYTGRRIHWTDIWLGPEAQMRERAAAWPEGEKVTAWVSPDDPSVAVLVRGVSAGSVAFLAFGLGSAWGMWFLARGLGAKRRLRG